MAAAFRTAWTWYERRLKTHPVATNACSTASIVCVGDAIAQYMERRYALRHTGHATLQTDAGEIGINIDIDPDVQLRRASRPIANYRNTDGYDWRRSAIFMSFVFMSTPVWLEVYKLGDRLIGGKTSVFKAVQQGFFTWGIASVMNPFFIGYVTAMSAVCIHKLYDPYQIKDSIVERLRHNYLTHVSLALGFWGSQWAIIFYYLPSHLRLFYVSWLQIAWNGVVSYIQHRD